MRFFRSYWITKLLLGYLLISFINSSIDPPDLLSNQDEDWAMEEDLNINEMESISELVLEEFMDLSDIVPESDESDTESLIKKLDMTSGEKYATNIEAELNVNFGTVLHPPFHQAIHNSLVSPPTQPPPHFFI